MMKNITNYGHNPNHSFGKPQPQSRKNPEAYGNLSPVLDRHMKVVAIIA